MKCSVCGNEIAEDSRFCPKCGAETMAEISDFIVATTPTVPGYKVTKVLGVVTGLTPRTTGVFGKMVAGIESFLGGEVTAFSAELERARMDAIRRVSRKAKDLGANAVIGLDLETSNVGLQMGIVIISATGSAVTVEKE